MKYVVGVVLGSQLGLCEEAFASVTIYLAPNWYSAKSALTFLYIDYNRHPATLAHEHKK